MSLDGAVVAIYAVYTSSIIETFATGRRWQLLLVLRSSLVGVALVDVVTADMARAYDNSWASIMRLHQTARVFVTHTSSHPLLPSRSFPIQFYGAMLSTTVYIEYNISLLCYFIIFGQRIHQISASSTLVAPNIYLLLPQQPHTTTDW